MTGTMVITTVVIVYLLLMLLVGVASRAKTNSKSDYYIAGRKLPGWIVAFSLNATGESAWLLLGLSGLAYVVGLSAVWIVVGETLGVWLSWTLLAKRIREKSAGRSVVTLPDLMTDALTDPRHILRIVSVVVILAMVMVYVAAQLLSTGKTFNSFLQWPYVTGVLVGGLVTIIYTSIGGFRGVAYTDALQAMLMLFAVIAVPLAGLIEVGGIEPLTLKLAEADGNMLNWFADSNDHMFQVVALISALAVGLPFLGVPQLLVRYIALDPKASIRHARTMSVTVIFLFGIGAVVTGLVGRALFPLIEDAETIMPMLSEALFPPLVTGLLFAAVLSAVMSTVSSLMNLASSALVGDIYHHLFNPNMDSQKIGQLGILVTLLVGAVGIGIALNQNSSIFDFVLFAWAGLGAAFGPPCLLAMWWKNTTWQGAVAGVSAGFLTTVAWLVFFKADYYQLYEMIPGFTVGLLTTIVVSLRPNQK